jgi:hypothetical protein
MCINGPPTTILATGDTMSSKRVWTAVLALSAVLALGCGGDDDGDDSSGGAGSTAGSGAGAGGGGTGGTAGTTAGTGGGTSGTGGTGGSAPMGVMCGTQMCTGSGFLQACCVDMATSTCGLMNSTFGIACGKPGVADPACPMQSISFMGVQGLTLTGCCTTDGMCGGFAMGSPCAVVPDLGGGDDDAGAAPAPTTCTPPP